MAPPIKLDKRSLIFCNKITACLVLVRQPKVMRIVSLKANFSWMFIGNLVYVISQGGILIVLAKLGTQIMVGRFILALAICSPVFLFTNLKLRDIQAADAQNKYQFFDFLGVRLLSTLTAFIIVLLIVVVADFPRETALVIMVIGLGKSFESVSDVIYGLLQKHEQMDGIAKSMIGKGIGALFFLSVVIQSTDSLLLGVCALVAAWGVVLLAYDLPNGLRILSQISSEPTGVFSQFSLILGKKEWGNRVAGKLTELTWLAFPLGVAATFTSLQMNIPNYLVAYYLSEKTLGIFGALAYPIVAGNVVVSALAQTALPRLSKYYVCRDRLNFNKLLIKLIGIAIFLGGIGVVVAFIWGTSLLSLLYSGVYAVYLSIFVWLMGAAGVNYVAWVLSSALTAIGIFRKQMLSRAISLLVVLVMSLVLIPKFGLLGAAWVICIRSIVSLVLFAIVFIGWNRDGWVY